LQFFVDIWWFCFVVLNAANCGGSDTKTMDLQRHPFFGRSVNDHLSPEKKWTSRRRDKVFFTAI
jgi:hypothetical protein